MSVKKSQPNFFILGAPKCGTTALSKYLGEHPNIFMTDPKEPNFFTRDFPVYQKQFKTREEYEQLYSTVTPQHKAIGEASVWYLYSKYAVPEILETYPEARFIVMVRNPVEMALSLHSQMLLMKEETVEDFETAWKLQEKRAKGGSLPKLCREPNFLQYRNVCSLGEQIERLYNIVNKERVKIVFFDDLKNDTRATYLDILNFLNIKDDGRTDFPVINANRVYRSAILQFIIIRAPSLLRPFIKPVKKALNIQRIGILEKLMNANMKTISRKPSNKNINDLILNDLSNDIQLIANITNRNLNNWIKK